jgi:hypothetical protein
VTFAKKNSRLLLLLLTIVLGAIATQARRVRGKLRIEVRDTGGAALAPAAVLLSQANRFHETFAGGSDGRYVAQGLPFGIYRLSLTAEGFAPWSDLIEVHSEAPSLVSVTMGVAPVTTHVQV